MNKTLTRSALALAVLASASFAAHADEEETSPLSGTVGLVSDYVFDGVTQTDNGPALQAGITYSTESGVYFGAWGSTVDFPGAGDTGVESDWYVGYGGSFSDSVAFDVGVTVYKYLGLSKIDSEDELGNPIKVDADYDYNEFYFGVTFAENLGLKLLKTSDYANGGESATRLKVNYSIELNDSWSMPLELNRWSADKAFQDYTHYKVGIATTVGPVGVELSYQKTDLDDNEYDETDGSLVKKGAYEDAYYSKGGFVLSLGTEF